MEMPDPWGPFSQEPPALGVYKHPSPHRGAGIMVGLWRLPANGAEHPCPATASRTRTYSTLKINRLPVGLHRREMCSGSLAGLHLFPLISAIAHGY